MKVSVNRQLSEILECDDSEIRKQLAKAERTAKKNKEVLTAWETEFIEGVCRRNWEYDLSSPQRRAAAGIIVKYRKNNAK